MQRLCKKVVENRICLKEFIFLFQTKVGRGAKRWTDFLIVITKLFEENILEIMHATASGDDTVPSGEDLILCVYIDAHYRLSFRIVFFSVGL